MSEVFHTKRHFIREHGHTSWRHCHRSRCRGGLQTRPDKVTANYRVDCDRVLARKQGDGLGRLCGKPGD